MNRVPAGKIYLVAAFVGLQLLLASLANAQGILINVNANEHVILPRPPIAGPYRDWRPPPQTEQSSYKIKQLDVNLKLDGQIAQVQTTQSFVNTGNRPMEVCFVFPLPYDGAVDQLTFLIDGQEHPAKLLDAKEARRMYEEIVRKNLDPALLEWMGAGLFKTSVFPVPPGAERKVTLRYSQLCRQWDGLTDFIFPLSTAKYTTQPIEEVKFQASIESETEIKNVYSPSHEVEIKRPDNRHAVISYSAKNTIPTDDFRLFYDVGKGLVGSKLLSYRPDPKDDGYFLLLASPEIKSADSQAAKKTVILAIDRSGSMSGQKIEQAKGAAKFVIEHLHEGDLFNLVTFDGDVQTWKPELQKFDDQSRKSAIGYIDGMYAGGSTNISGALTTALSQLHDANQASFVIFLTDGIPTDGETNEGKIVAAAKAANTVHARIFDFGVGYDVNSRLLDKLASENFGLTEYVRPNENIERAVAALYSRISSPVMTGVKLAINVDGGKAEGVTVNRIYPKDVVDLFAGEQLVIVGRYKTPGAAKITITGKVGAAGTSGDGAEQKFDFAATLAEHSGDQSQAFIEKLWAVRRIGEILDQIDLKGHNEELVKELVSLSLQHGIMTPYTSFLADENARRDKVSVEKAATERLSELDRYAEGEQGVAQRANKHAMQNMNQPAAAAPASLGLSLAPSMGGAASASSPQFSSAVKGKEFFGAVAASKDEDAKVVQNVRQIGRKAFFQRDQRWVDSSLTPEQEKNVVKVQRFSTQYFDLIDKYPGETSKYLSVDEPVTLLLDNQAYEID